MDPCGGVQYVRQTYLCGSTSQTSCLVTITGSACGPRDVSVVEDGERVSAIADQYGLETVHL